MSRLVDVSRLIAVPALAMAAIGLAVPAANAAPAPVKFDADLTELWTTVLETPSAENPFGTGGPETACWNLSDGTLAPFGAPDLTCTVKPGTKFLVLGYSDECSTFENNGSTEAELRTCAEQGDALPTPSIAVDGRAVPVKERETPLMNIVLPAENLFGLPAGTTGLSVGHGWIAHVHPLTPGTHTFTGSATLSTGESVSFMTTVIVEPGGRA